MIHKFSRAPYYVLWVLLRVLCTFFLPGYIHPDESHQSIEPIYAWSNNLASRIPWEWSDCANGVRSPSGLLVSIAGLPIFIEKYLLQYLTNGIMACAFHWFLLRCSCLGLSLVTDLIFLKLIKKYELSERRALVLLSFSWPLSILATRPFSNAAETWIVLATWCMQDALSRYFQSPMLTIRPWLQKFMKITLLSTAIGAILTLGVFTRFTYVLFASPVVWNCLLTYVIIPVVDYSVSIWNLSAINNMQKSSEMQPLNDGQSYYANFFNSVHGVFARKDTRRSDETAPGRSSNSTFESDSTLHRFTRTRAQSSTESQVAASLGTNNENLAPSEPEDAVDAVSASSSALASSSTRFAREDRLNRQVRHFVQRKMHAKCKFLWGMYIAFNIFYWYMLTTVLYSGIDSVLAGQLKWAPASRKSAPFVDTSFALDIQELKKVGSVAKLSPNLVETGKYTIDIPDNEELESVGIIGRPNGDELESPDLTRLRLAEKSNFERISEYFSYQYASLRLFFKHPSISSCFFFLAAPMNGVFYVVQGRHLLGKFIFPPLALFRYNKNPENLAKHGKHPLWLHVVVNLPMLYAPLLLFVFFRGYCSVRILAKRRMWRFRKPLNQRRGRQIGTDMSPSGRESDLVRRRSNDSGSSDSTDVEGNKTEGRNGFESPFDFTEEWPRFLYWCRLVWTDEVYRGFQLRKLGYYFARFATQGMDTGEWASSRIRRLPWMGLSGRKYSFSQAQLAWRGRDIGLALGNGKGNGEDRIQSEDSIRRNDVEESPAVVLRRRPDGREKGARVSDGEQRSSRRKTRTGSNISDMAAELGKNKTAVSPRIILQDSPLYPVFPMPQTLLLRSYRTQRIIAIQMLLLPLLVLSLAPHQEPRFLLPLVYPLLFLCLSKTWDTRGMRMHRRMQLRTRGSYLMTPPFTDTTEGFSKEDNRDRRSQSGDFASSSKVTEEDEGVGNREIRPGLTESRATRRNGAKERGSRTKPRIDPKYADSERKLLSPASRRIASSLEHEASIADSTNSDLPQGFRCRRGRHGSSVFPPVEELSPSSITRSQRSKNLPARPNTASTGSPLASESPTFHTALHEGDQIGGPRSKDNLMPSDDNSKRRMPMYQNGIGGREIHFPVKYYVGLVLFNIVLALFWGGLHQSGVYPSIFFLCDVKRHLYAPTPKHSRTLAMSLERREIRDKRRVTYMTNDAIDSHEGGESVGSPGSFSGSPPISTGMRNQSNQTSPSNRHLGQNSVSDSIVHSHGNIAHNLISLAAVIVEIAVNSPILCHLFGSCEQRIRLTIPGLDYPATCSNVLASASVYHPFRTIESTVEHYRACLSNSHGYDAETHREGAKDKVTSETSLNDPSIQFKTGHLPLGKKLRRLPHFFDRTSRVISSLFQDNSSSAFSNQGTSIFNNVQTNFISESGDISIEQYEITPDTYHKYLSIFPLSFIQYSTGLFDWMRQEESIAFDYKRRDIRDLAQIHPIVVYGTYIPPSSFLNQMAYSTPQSRQSNSVGKAATDSEPSFSGFMGAHSSRPYPISPLPWCLESEVGFSLADGWLRMPTSTHGSPSCGPYASVESARGSSNHSQSAHEAPRGGIITTNASKRVSPTLLLHEIQDGSIAKLANTMLSIFTNSHAPPVYKYKQGVAVDDKNIDPSNAQKGLGSTTEDPFLPSALFHSLLLQQNGSREYDTEESAVVAPPIASSRKAVVMYPNSMHSEVNAATYWSCHEFVSWYRQEVGCKGDIEGEDAVADHCSSLWKGRAHKENILRVFPHISTEHFHFAAMELQAWVVQCHVYSI